MKSQTNIFKIKSISVILAILCAIAWAMAFPLIKIGLNAFQIDQTDTAGKTLFAGIRFFVAGLTVMIIAKFMNKSFRVQHKKDMLLLFLFGLVNTALHYFFFYIGVSNLSGSRSAILDSLGSFLLIILSCVCFKDDKFNIYKLFGCVLGLSGIVLINFNGTSELFSNITLSGDGMLALSSLCAALGGILTRIASKNTDIIVATGVSLTIGGALLVTAGILSGGRISYISMTGVIALLLLIFISAFSFAIYNQLICYNPVSHIAIFNALIPVLGVIFSCMILDESFDVKYIIAGAVVALGIYIINKNRN